MGQGHKNNDGNGYKVLAGGIGGQGIQGVQGTLGVGNDGASASQGIPRSSRYF